MLFFFFVFTSEEEVICGTSKQFWEFSQSPQKLFEGAKQSASQRLELYECDSQSDLFQLHSILFAH